MNVVIPYTYINPIVKGIIDRDAKDEGFTTSFVKMEDKNNYWRLLTEIWEHREEVILLEHDIIPWPGALTELADCPFDWCSYTYKMKGGYGIHHAFGCTKFGVGLMEKMPDVWYQVDNTLWNTLDAQLCELAKREGLTPHPHRPPVTHVKGLYDEADTIEGGEPTDSQGEEGVLQHHETYLVREASILPVQLGEG